IERPRPEAQNCEIKHLLEAPSSWTVIFDDPTVRNELIECIELLTALTKEQTAEVREIIDETISNHSFYDPQALELFLE
ncbi:18894_t:CDS:2, partial [Racocetra fulgida]